METIERFFNQIKQDFLDNKIKFAVLLIAVVLWIIGEANPASEHIGPCSANVFSAVLTLFGAFLLFSICNGLPFIKKHSMAVLIFWVAFFLFIVVYKRAKPDYPVENDVMLMAVLIYGTLPYAVKNRKTYGVILGAFVTAVCVAALAIQSLWWSVFAFEWVAILTQLMIAAMDVYGGRRLVRIAEVCLLNALFILAALFLVCGKIPHISGSFEPFSKAEIISLILLYVFIVFSAISVFLYKNKNWYAVSVLIALVTQIILFAFSRTTPELSGYLGLPFVESDALNRISFMPLAVAIILSTPTGGNPISLKRIFEDFCAAFHIKNREQ